MRKKTIFLDRDGVLVTVSLHDGKPQSPLSLSDLHLTQGAIEALTRLAARGFLLIVITNRPEIAKHILSRETVSRMHQLLHRDLPLDAIYLCPHCDEDQCACRKPKTGLIQQAMQTFDIDITASYFIGDQEKDIEAGAKAGCSTILINAPYNRTISRQPDRRVASITDAATWIIEQA